MFAKLEVFNQFGFSTTDRQKVTHKSPPCHLHRWAQKSRTFQGPSKFLTKIKDFSRINMKFRDFKDFSTMWQPDDVLKIAVLSGLLTDPAEMGS